MNVRCGLHSTCGEGGGKLVSTGLVDDLGRFIGGFQEDGEVDYARGLFFVDGHGLPP